MLLLAMVAATVTLSVSTTAMFVKHTEAANAEAARGATLSALLAPPPMPQAHPATLLAALVGQLDPATLPPGAPKDAPRPPPTFTLGNLSHHRHAPAPEAAATAPPTPGGDRGPARNTGGPRSSDPPPPPRPPAAAGPASGGDAAANLQALVLGTEPPDVAPPAPPPPPLLSFQSIGQVARDMSAAIGVWREKRNWVENMGADPERRRRRLRALPRRRLRSAEPWGRGLIGCHKSV